jgi:Domain of unknown function (DUF4382)
MNTKKKVLTSGTIAALVAIALIVAVTYIPAIGYSQSGTLSVMLTDPPTVPTGVTALAMTYNNVQVHVSNAGNQSGWINVGGSGTINLMSVVNFSQTIATAKIHEGTFNALRFNITSVSVTYNGQTYAADLVYGHTAFFVRIPGGISVAAAQSSTALVDLSPQVLLLGTPQSPIFAFLPSGRAFVVPSQQVPAESHSVGYRMSLSAAAWWASFEAGTKFGVTSSQLTPNSFSLTVQNQGNASALFRLAAVTSQTSLSGGPMPLLSESEIFVVEPNATLVAITSGTSAQVYQEISAGGYLLLPGQSVTFTYSGQVQLGILNFGGFPTQQIVVGQNYHALLYGNDQIAQFGVTAAS